MHVLRLLGVLVLSFLGGCSAAEQVALAILPDQQRAWPVPSLAPRQQDRATERALAARPKPKSAKVPKLQIQLKGELTGWDVAEAFRVAQPTMPVIYVSGNAPVPSRLVPKSVFYQKPYDPRTILQVCEAFT